MKKKGSALIFMFLFLTFISALVIVFLRNSMLFYTFSLDRVSHTQHRYALDAVAQYGIAYSHAHQEDLTKDVRLTYEHWPLPSGCYQATVLILPQKKKRYRLRARLSQEKAQLGEIICEYKLSQKEINISHWQTT